MKNISTVFNVVLSIAVCTLFYLHFSSSKAESSSIQNDTSAPGEYKVAYINSDSILSKYDYFKDIQGKLRDKGTKLEKEYQNRAQGLQQEVNDYQRTVNSLTIGQAKALEENLMKKQQNLRLYQESLTQELMQEESKMNQELYKKITSFLKTFSAEHNIDLVVKYDQGSDVLYANTGMDVTNSVIEGLNASYKEENLGENKTNKPDSISNKK